MKQERPNGFAARLGCVTASRVADAVAMTKSGPSERREKYLLQVVAERVTGQATQSFVTADMQRGIDDEPMARSLTSWQPIRLVSVPGFVLHPEIERCGASPDGRDGDLLCRDQVPETGRHIATIRAGKPPADYLPQMMILQMACTGAQAVDFVSYCSAMPDHARLCIVRLERDDKAIEEMEEKVRAFLADVDRSQTGFELLT